MTRKKMEKLIRRVYFHHWHLQRALNDAHSAGLIKYEEFKGNAPCESMYEVESRFEKTTDKQIAETVRRDIRNKV